MSYLSKRVGVARSRPGADQRPRPRRRRRCERRVPDQAERSVRLEAPPQEGQTLNGLTGQWLDAQRSALHRLQDELHLAALQRRTSAAAPTFPAPPATRTCSAPPTSGRRIRFVEWIFKRDCGEWNYSTGTQECHDVTKNGASALTATVVSRSRSRPRTATGTPDRAGHRRWRMRSCARPGRRGPARGRSRRRSSGSAATRPVRAASTVAGATGATYRLTAGDVGTRIRVVETASNEGGTAQAVSTRDRRRRRAACRRRAGRRLPRHEGRAAPPPRARTRWSRKQKGDNRDAPGQGLRRPRLPGRRRPGSGHADRPARGLVRAEDEPAERLGDVHLPRDRHRARPTCSSRPAGRARSRRAASRPRTCSGSGSARPFSGRRVSAETPSENLEMRPFLPSGQEGADPSQRSNSARACLARASSLSSSPLTLTLLFAGAARPRRRRSNTPAIDHRHRRGRRSS